jgi:hypothetical protein
MLLALFSNEIYSKILSKLNAINIRYDAIDPELRFLGITLCWLQLMDAVLTYFGVCKFGACEEGNPMLRSLILYYGHSNGLFLSKLPSLFFIFFFVRNGQNVIWAKPALKLVVVFYLYAALLPWVWALV